MPFELPTAEAKAEYVLRQFDRIAHGYDRANDVISFGMHRSWKARAIAALGMEPAGSYLDVCTGTGDLALAMNKRLGALGKVCGLDFSPKMLEVARRRASHHRQGQGSPLLELPPIEWTCGDAQNLPFADNSFDGAIISFGLRNLTDFAKGIAEMARVVKPGGAVVNLDLGRPTAPIFTPAYFFFFAKVVPLLGHLLQNDREAYTYLPQSLTAYPEPLGITKIFKEAGLQNIVYEPLGFGTVALHKGIVL